jgi:hypothetical protein
VRSRSSATAGFTPVSCGAGHLPPPRSTARESGGAGRTRDGLLERTQRFKVAGDAPRKTTYLSNGLVALPLRSG